MVSLGGTVHGVMQRSLLLLSKGGVSDCWRGGALGQHLLQRQHSLRRARAATHCGAQAGAAAVRTAYRHGTGHDTNVYYCFS